MLNECTASQVSNSPVQLHSANFHGTWLVGNPDLKHFLSTKMRSRSLLDSKTNKYKNLDGQEEL